MKKYRILFLILLFSVTLFRLFYIQSLSLCPDEAYYWCWSQSLSLSYYDHPPMVAYFIFFFTWLGRNSEFFVRLSSVLISFALTIFAYLLGRDIFKSEEVGFFSALLLNIIPGFSIGGIIITPDIPLVFFWTLTFYLLYQLVKKDNKNLWYLLGISLGLGLLSKYNMVLFLPCALIFLLLFKENRKWFRYKEPYLALLIAFLIFLPVIIWNYNHSWVSFTKQIGHGLGKKGSSLINLGAYLGSQAGIISPFIFFALIWAMIKSFRIGIRKQDGNLLLLFSFSLPIILLFALTSLRARVEANWPAVGYLTASIALAGLWARRFEKRKGPLLIPLTIVVLLSGFLLTVTMHYPSLMGLVYNAVPADVDPFNRLSGWPQLGGRIDEIMERMEKDRTFIFTPRHQLASEIAFYASKKKDRIYALNGKDRYEYWGRVDLKGRDAVFVTLSGYNKADWILSHFRSFQEEEPLKIYRRGKLAKTFTIWRCYDYYGGLLGEKEGYFFKE